MALVPCSYQDVSTGNRVRERLDDSGRSVGASTSWPHLMQTSRVCRARSY